MPQMHREDYQLILVMSWVKTILLSLLIFAAIWPFALGVAMIIFDAENTFFGVVLALAGIGLGYLAISLIRSIWVTWRRRYKRAMQTADKRPAIQKA